MFYMVIASDIDNTQRSLIHEAIKKIADTWWHQWEDCWIVGTDVGMTQLSTQLLPFSYIDGSEMLILALKEDQGGRWAAKMETGRSKWLMENMSSDNLASVDELWASPAADTWPPNAIGGPADPWASPAEIAKRRAAENIKPTSTKQDEPPF